LTLLRKEKRGRKKTRSWREDPQMPSGRHLPPLWKSPTTGTRPSLMQLLTVTHCPRSSSLWRPQVAHRCAPSQRAHLMSLAQSYPTSSGQVGRPPVPVWPFPARPASNATTDGRPWCWHVLHVRGHSCATRLCVGPVLHWSGVMKKHAGC